MEHVAALWPGFLEGRPLGGKAILRPRADHGWAQSERRDHRVRRLSAPSSAGRKLADELLFVSARPEAGTREAQIGAIAHYLTALAGAPECYVSVNTFFGRRKHESLKHLTCLMVDLDLSKALERGHDYGGDFMAMRQSALDAISGAGIPTPNLATHTGRGVHLYWLFDSTLPAAAAPRWLACLKVLIQLLHPFGADPSVRDTARVLRLVGTVNSSAPAHCKTVTAEVLVPARQDFDFLADQILPLTRAELAEARSARLIELAPKRAQRDARRQMKGEATDTASRRPGRSFSATATARLTDLTLLASKLFPEGITEGNRDRYLFAATCSLAWMCREENLESEMLAWKARHIPDMADADAIAAMGAALRKAQESYQARAGGAKFRPYDDPRYLHSAAALWQMFGHDIEYVSMVASMQVILPEGVLRERRQAARRAKSPDHYTGQGIREANVPRARQALILRDQGLSLRDIAEALATTPKTISAWLELPPHALGMASVSLPVQPSPAEPATAVSPLPWAASPPSYPQTAAVLPFARQVLPKCSLNNGCAVRLLEKASSMPVAQGGSGGISGSPLAGKTPKADAQAVDVHSKPTARVISMQKPNQSDLKKGLALPAKPDAALSSRAAPDKRQDSESGIRATRTTQPRDRFDEILLAELRRWPLEDGFEAIGLHFKADLSYVPRSCDKRVHVTRASGQVIELVLTGSKWVDTQADEARPKGKKNGGFGFISLAMYLLECNFVTAVRALTIAWPARRH
ncbi:hypothetical protein [Variovorax saccharolyticus]|uniref:hypothetical protein n=1 Tax=Variovorax saccharolyticus TaxID=3053516 RepID=UPI002577BF27|nr:hypothetical protein [Variovorax sp. J31P216]MDM0029138.1 hypothetical protein [Variovorax sp. J31P216]